TNPLSVTMTANKNIKATFTAIASTTTYTLAVNMVGLGSVSPAVGTFVEGTTQILSASPATGYTFTGWSGDATGSTNPLSVTMTANKNITATFTAISTDIDLSADIVQSRIYPNPSTNTFMLELGTPLDVAIYSITGQLVFSYKRVVYAEFGEELNPGVYIVKAGESFFKIIKE
ncbi:T9SS type A sorting domain-containing protein, partial [uncultured Cytophaga sp.]|uniref:InlB B-repeat-containing protein n=1 Tax=uncultured Cytophaga sp. TaxID=160238 RepID=UPI002607D68F